MIASTFNHPATQLPASGSFAELAQPGVTVPVWRELLADMETPVSAYRKLADGASHAALLESVEGGEHAAHVSIVAANPRAVATYRDGEVSVTLADGTVATADSDDPAVRVLAGLSGDPLDLFTAECSRTVVTPEGVPVPRLAGGAIGYLGYGCVRLWEDTLPASGPDVLGFPDAVLLLFDTALVFDRLTHRVIAVTNVHVPIDADADGSTYDRDEAYAIATRVLDDLVATLSAPTTSLVTDVSGLIRDGGVTAPSACNTEPADFQAAVGRAKEHIMAGDVIQLVLSQRWTRPTAADPFDVYRALRVVNPSPYMFCLKLDGVYIVGASPELLVQVAGRRVTTHPIAGTRPRGATPELDVELEGDLLADQKERAEHVMLVDLGRNDIGRVSTPGSVRVDNLMQVERFSHVMHITSKVTGELMAGATAVDALRSCFPAGTVSGAPKLRALELISELEPDARGPYAGAMGCMTYGGDLDLAITIRTLVIHDGIATVSAGAGIVADSNPVSEYEETRSKARAMLRAIDVAEGFGGER